ncbi:MAG: carboxylesterase family protein [Polyangiaceae bacterium]|nr:carboxylesterase family protein [Polyangiaceae bacterium]
MYLYACQVLGRYKTLLAGCTLLCALGCSTHADSGILGDGDASAGTGGLGPSSGSGASAGLGVNSGTGASAALGGSPSGTGGGSSVATQCGSGIPIEPGMVATEQGVVRGVSAGEAWSYKKIPFAAPPLGSLRWKAPEPAACWEGVRDGASFGPLCPQLDANGSLVGEEDCLQLNVWAPKAPTAQKLPVLFWIHGGGHIQGGAAQPSGTGYIYDGQSFVERTGVVIVTINYRLGSLGFLGHTALSAEPGAQGSANYGTLDQLAALKWVKRNIEAFGGDPARVTIFGESAGGVSVCTLLASPLGKGLFASAIIESGGCNARTLAEEETFGAELFQAAGCQTAPDPLACMRALPMEQVVRAKPVQIDVAGKPSVYGSVVDGYVLSDTPAKIIARGEHNRVPVIIGNNDAETNKSVPTTLQTEAQYLAAVKALIPVGTDAVLAAYPASAYPTPRAAYVALTSDAKFVCGARQAALSLDAQQTEGVFRYVFTHVSATLPPLVRAAGASHALEVPYVFGTMKTIPNFTPDAGDEAVSLAMQKYWARFAATGDPNGEGAQAWPAYLPSDPYIEFADPLRVGLGFHAAQCDFWASFVP